MQMQQVPAFAAAQPPADAMLCRMGVGAFQPRTTAFGAGGVLASWPKGLPLEPRDRPQQQGAHLWQAGVEAGLHPGGTIGLVCDDAGVQQDDRRSACQVQEAWTAWHKTDAAAAAAAAGVHVVAVGTGVAVVTGLVRAVSREPDLRAGADQNSIGSMYR